MISSVDPEKSRERRERRCFVRQDHFLTDPPEVDTNSTIHLSLLGVQLSNGERAHWIERLSAGDIETQQRAIAVLAGDQSEEYKAALLQALDNGTPDSAMALTAFVDDARVRPALIDAFRRATRSQVSAYAAVIGVVGGPGALDALKDRLAEVMLPFRSHVEIQATEDDTERLLAVAQALLRLDPEATSAAVLLLRAVRGPTPGHRGEIVERIVEVLQPHLQTKAMRSLARELRGFLHDEEVTSFLAAVPFLVREQGEEVLSRCEAILFEERQTALREVILALSRVPFPWVGRASALLVKWVERGDGPLDALVWASGLILDFLKPDSFEAMLRQALIAPSPSIRFDAIRLLERHVRRSELCRLLRDAAIDEPDPWLLKEMQRVIQDSERAAHQGDEPE